MAKVKQLITCKACGAEVVDHNSSKCHVCGFTHLAKLPYEVRYGSPDYLVFQRDDIKSRFKEGSKNYDMEMSKIEEEMILWVRNAPEEEKIAAMLDALLCMQQLLLSSSSSEAVKRITKIGISIGEIAHSIEGYVKAKGALNVTRTIETAELRDGSEGDADS
jgi:hypothetical protein